MTKISSRIASSVMAIALSGSLVMAVPALDTVAHASTVSKGRIQKFTYNADTKIGHLTLLNYKGTMKYKTTKDTDCGYSTGQSGGPIPCRTLGQDKYHNKPARVTWKYTDSGARKAIQVVVDLS